ncbi:MAG: nucleotidyl transferase AbiEii/AbiGii toxin family protein [Patescibacteria group bacterium]|nr:nucleotidyl transferase AbiEii/AbiGii toxin family protein [Patescibacteria group bacterium]
MSNFIFYHFPKILDFARFYGIPVEKKESILREYLQVKILEKIYQYRLSYKLFFVGGTSLRILSDLDRFSEDLDFDYKDLKPSEIEKIYDYVVDGLEKENIEIIRYKNTDKKPIEFEIRFPKILHQLGLHNNPSKNLVIKLDFDNFWQGLEPEIIRVEKFGILTDILTLDKNKILVQKMFAFLNRKQVMARDIYDIYWLIANSAKLDWNFIKKNNISENIKEMVKKKLVKEKNKFMNYKKQLEPLLINNFSVNKIDFIFDYFISSEDIIFKNFQKKEITEQDQYHFIFNFESKTLDNAKKNIKFAFCISETALPQIDLLPIDDYDEEKVAFIVQKIKKFFNKNIIKDYQTKLISTTNLNEILNFEEIAISV